MRTFTIGSTAISAVLDLKHNSRNKFSLFFWDDAANTVPTVLTGATVTIELYETPGAAPTVWTGTNSVNEVVFDESAATCQFTWDTRPFRVVFTKAAIPDAVMTGEARVQR